MILIDCPVVKSSSHISAHCGECETWHIIAREERSGFQGAFLATTHAYDGLDRLAADGGVAYTYDAAGNRMTRTENGETIAYTLGVGDRLASWTGGSYTYNAAGCVTRIERNGRPTLDLTWNSQYQLASVSTNGVFAESYAYDALGRRVSTTTLDGTVCHIYDDSWQCLADIDENGNVICSYVWGVDFDNLLAVKIGGESYYPLTDIQGTVWGYADSQNNVVARWTYDAWGNVLSEEVSVSEITAVRYRFQGRGLSHATGLINFRMRWYDAVTGRWLSKDPIGLSGGLNLYAFCKSNPIKNTDPAGMFELCSWQEILDFWSKINKRREEIYREEYECPTMDVIESLSIVSIGSLAKEIISGKMVSAIGFIANTEAANATLAGANASGNIIQKIHAAERGASVAKTTSTLSKGLLGLSKVSGYVTVGATACYFGAQVESFGAAIIEALMGGN